MNIKTKLKLFSTALFATVAAASVSQSQASTTNVLQSVNVALTVYAEGPTNRAGTSGSVKIVSKSLTTPQLVAALGADPSVTSKPFSSAAMLALDNIVGPNNGGGLVVVDGNTITPVPTSVINYQALQQLAATVQTAAGTTTAESDVDFVSLTFNIANAWNFATMGVETATQVNIPLGSGKTAGTVSVDNATINLSGSGTQGTNDTTIIVSGKITTAYSKILVTP
jgi:hypothetical protein